MKLAIKESYSEANDVGSSVGRHSNWGSWSSAAVVRGISIMLSHYCPNKKRRCKKLNCC